MSGRAKLRISKPGQRGQAALEFAFVVVVLVVLMVSILEMTMFVYTYSALTDAAKEGVRYALVHGSSGTAAAGPTGGSGCLSSGPVVNTVQTYAALSLHSATSMSINVCYPDSSNQPGSRVQVNLNYPYQPLFGLRWASVTISATSAGRIMF
jgi:Flp pilus assembly protein TadG